MDEDLSISEFDTLVLSGGSVMAISIIGALQYLKDNNLISHIKHYIGTSAGAIISYLLIIGYTPIEIIIYLCTNHQLFEKLKYINVVSASRGEGATTFLHVSEQIEKMTIDKTGRLYTMADIQSIFNKNLVCVTYNITKNQTEYLSPNLTPNLPCITALRMSCNLPLVFEAFKYGDSFYIDGGLANNFAVDEAELLGKRIIGINLDYDICEDNPHKNLIEYIYKLILVPVIQSIKYRIKNAQKSTIIVQIKSKNSIKFFDFDVNAKIKLELFSMGYEECKKQFLKN